MSASFHVKTCACGRKFPVICRGHATVTVCPRCLTGLDFVFPLDIFRRGK